MSFDKVRQGLASDLEEIKSAGYGKLKEILAPIKQTKSP